MKRPISKNIGPIKNIRPIKKKSQRQKSKEKLTYRRILEPFFRKNT